MSWIEAMACGVPKIIGNNEGIGQKLNIYKVKNNEDISDVIKNATQKNYRKQVLESYLTWKNHVNKLLRIWRK